MDYHDYLEMVSKKLKENLDKPEEYSRLCYLIRDTTDDMIRRIEHVVKENKESKP